VLLKLWKISEGRAVIGDGAPFDAQSPRPGGFQGWNSGRSYWANLDASTWLNTMAGKKLRCDCRRDNEFGAGGATKGESSNHVERKMCRPWRGSPVVRAHSQRLPFSRRAGSAQARWATLFRPCGTWRKPKFARSTQRWPINPAARPLLTHSRDCWGARR